MKNLSKFIYGLLTFAFVAVSCNKVGLEENYTPGEPDVEGCYGIFFPAQDFSAYATLDPMDDTVIPVTVKRSVSTGAISVTPEVVCKESGVFTSSPIVFEDGQEETTIEVSFPNAEIGKTYSCTIQVTDPQYVSKYSSNAAFVTFSVTRVKWNYLGKAKWTDDLFTTFYDVPLSTTWEVEAYENDLVKGLYRISDPFGENCPFNDPGDWDTDKDYWVEIHAEDPTKVYILPTKTSCHWSYGYFWIGSDAGYDIAAGKTIAEAEALGDAFGTITNGVIKFPVKGLLIMMEQYKNGAWYYGNTNGLFKLILPGGVDVDYSLSAKAGFTKDGKLPVTFTTGVDVAKIRFESFEGELDEKGVKEKVTALSAGKTEFSSEVEVESTTTTVDLSYEKTGIYTVVAVSLDDTGAAQKNTSIVVNYVAAGDEEDKAVDIKLGINTAEKYRGVNTDTTLEVWAFSDNADIKDAKMGLFSRADLGDVAACVEALMGSKSVGADIIEDINETGFISPVSGLLPGTEYYLLMWASNGFEEDIFMSKVGAKTTGKPLPIYQSFTYQSYAEEFEPKDATVFAGKEFNLYAVDYLGSTGLREFIGKVTFVDDGKIGPDEDGYYNEYLSVSGFAGKYAKKLSFDDTVEFDLYAGCLYIASNETADGTTMFVYSAAGDTWYNSPAFASYFIPVMEGYYAYVSSSKYYGSYNFTGLGFGKGGLQCSLSDYLLVDPEIDDNGVVPSSTASISASIDMKVRAATFGKAVKEARTKNANAPKSVKVYGKLSKAEGYNAVSVKTGFQVASNTSRTVVDRSSLKANGEICRAAR